MQVLSNRFNQTQRSASTQRNRKRGLSLTSRSKCNSLPKPSQHFEEAQTLQSEQLNNKSTQNSIRFSTENYQQPSTYFSGDRNQTSFSYSTQRYISQKPKITFRYSNQICHQNQVMNNRPNPFLKNSDEPLHPQQIRERFRPCQQLRNVVVTKSIETKMPSQITFNTEKNVNANRILIDSRRVERNIQQEIYQSFPTVNQSTPQITVNPPSTFNQSQEKQELQNFQKSKGFLDQNQSPYHLLVSSVKKCQGKELSPRLIQQNLKNDTFTQKTLPQIKQFRLTQVVIEERQQDSPSTSRVFENNQKIENDSQLNKKQDTSETVVNIQKQKQLCFYDTTSVKTELEIKAENSRSILQLRSNNKMPENKNLSDKKTIKSSPQKVILTKKSQNSPKKIIRNNSSKNVLEDIENRQPESNTNSSALSGRRNIKRFKEIERRLQEIITICGKNL